MKSVEKGVVSNPVSNPVDYRLPLAPESGVYSIADYESYEAARELFFESSAGGIAGRSGGMVARLWRKNVRRFNERASKVNQGPSEEALAHGVRVYCSPERVYYDDYLFASLDSYICGQYHARQG